jgi:hypothetical protein
MKTIKQTHRIISRATKLLRPIDLGVVLLDKKAIVRNWGRGSLAKDRKRFGPGILEKAYRKLPKKMLREFVLLTGEHDPAPTRKEFRRFERRFLESIRQTVNQEIRKRTSKLPRPVGRRERNRKMTTLIAETVKRLQKQGYEITRAVVETAREVKCHRATVWRHLARTRLASARARSALPSKPGQARTAPIRDAVENAPGPPPAALQKPPPAQIRQVGVVAPDGVVPDAGGQMRHVHGPAIGQRRQGFPFQPVVTVHRPFRRFPPRFPPLCRVSP